MGLCADFSNYISYLKKWRAAKGPLEAKSCLIFFGNSPLKASILLGPLQISYTVLPGLKTVEIQKEVYDTESEYMQ